MPHTARPPSSNTLATMAVGLSVLAVGLLVAGSTAGHFALLAWGLLSAAIAVNVVVVAVISTMIDAAVERCVSQTQAQIEEAVRETACKVGQAIAEGLAEDMLRPPQPRAGVRSLY